jgi:guanylate kinase
VEYTFLSREEFTSAIEQDRFLEWAEYGGNLYGTLRAEVERSLAAGDDVLLEIELQGARSVRRAVPQACLVFIAPPDVEELSRRLRGRGTETAEAVAMRLRIAQTELAAAQEFDHVVVNDAAARAAAVVVALIEARRKEH